MDGIRNDIFNWSTKVETISNWESSINAQNQDVWEHSLRATSTTMSEMLDIRTICQRTCVTLTCNTVKLSQFTRKFLNKRVKITNGNGQMRKSVTVLHWNIGASMWQRKLLEIEAVVLQYKPVIFVVSEANLPVTLSEDEQHVQGYKIILPKIRDKHRIYIIVILVREGLELKVLQQYSDKYVAAVWLKLGARGRKPMTLGCIYREHQFIHLDFPDDSGTDENQLIRWNIFITQWKAATVNSDVVVVGDTNLDFLRWGAPSKKVENMVENTKAEIETLGYHQMVTGVTRTWPDQPDSCLDQIWTNSPARLIYFKNIKHAV